VAATVPAGASPFHPGVLSVPEGDLVLLADDPAPVGLHPDERLAAVAAAVDWVPARLFRDDLFLGDWLPDGMKSADGRMASAADSAGKKPCPTKTEKIPLDSDRPSRGRRLHSSMSLLPLGGGILTVVAIFSPASLGSLAMFSLSTSTL